MTDQAYDGRDLEAMSFANNYHEWILSLFRPYLQNRVVEVGAGVGSFSELLLKEPIRDLIAIEPSKAMYAELQKRVRDPRIQAHNAFFADLHFQNRFECVMYVNVLEHIDKDEAELVAAYQALSQGGHLCIFVPALPFLMSAHDKSIGHFRRYTKCSLFRKVTNAGFEIKSGGYFDIAGIGPWYVLCTVLGRSPRGGAVGLYDRVFVPIMRVVESVLPIPVGKNLYLVAQKPIDRTQES